MIAAELEIKKAPPIAWISLKIIINRAARLPLPGTRNNKIDPAANIQNPSKR